MASNILVLRGTTRRACGSSSSSSSSVARRSWAVVTQRSKSIQATNVDVSGRGGVNSGGAYNRHPASRLSFLSSAATAEASSGEYSTDEDERQQQSSSSNGEPIHSEIDMRLVVELANQKPTALSLRDMYKYATSSDPRQRLFNAQFLKEELPIRIAQRAVDLLTLPYGLNHTMPIQNVAHIYLRYMDKIQKMKVPMTQEDEDAFTDLLESFLKDRKSIPTEIAQGLREWRDDRKEDLDPTRRQEMEDALYRFFTARAGLRLLTEHHILSSPHRSRKSWLRDDHIRPSMNLGCIQTNCNPFDEVKAVAAEVTRQTKNHYGVCPEIDIVNINSSEFTDVFTYVPHFLEYIMAELLKNSCRATVKKFLADEADDDPSAKMKPIQVVVVNGAEDVTIKVADSGGGVPRSKLDQIWKFSHSTADDIENSTEFGTDFLTGGRIRGFGLPLARIHARYFGGELTLKTMEGYGLDVYLYLPRLGDACENLPGPVSNSPGNLDSTPTTESNKDGAKASGEAGYKSLDGFVRSHPMPFSASSREAFAERERRRILEYLHDRAL